MLTSQVSTLFASLSVLLVCSCTYAQYGPSNGYRKGNSGGGASLKSMPVMIISPSAAPQPAASYKQMSMAPMMRSGGYGGTKSAQRSSDMGYQAMPVKAAIKSHHTVDYKEVPSEPLNIQPQTILVEAQNIPLNILFQSKSSDLNLQSEHIPSKGGLQETSSEDEPHVLKHSVTKPIIQEVYEIITPYRKITQEIQPVKEEIQTIVSRAAKDNKYEPVNGKYGDNQMNVQQQQQQQAPKQYGSGNEFAEMMNALKMEIPKSFMQPLSGYGAKQSRMQLYMSQLGEQPKIESLDDGMVVGGKSGRTESLPLVEMSEPDPKEGNGSAQSDALDDAIGEEKEVAAGEASTQSSAQDKSLASLMLYGGVPLTGAKATTAAPKLVTGRTFLQTSNYAESNTEPTGY